LSESIEGNLVIVSTEIDKETAQIPSLVEVFAGSNWHEREAFEMFGIEFINHPNLTKMYLPDDYEGNPMLKSFELISREVKPWPGEVDVEGMPEDSTVEGAS
jgi:NADH-quinone oxidoreductase subunit C